MKTLIIYAHPETPGHAPETLNQVELKLKKTSSEYEVIDLYKIGYNPVLQNDEHYTTGNRNISQQNIEIQNKINQSENLIFIYPIWWGTMPAILKGFFDRILTRGFAFSMGNHGIPNKLLKGKKAVVFTSSGSPYILYLLSNLSKTLIKNKILGFCGIKTKVFQVYSANKLDEKNIQKIKKNVDKGFKFLDL
ncbi:NAD(P)H-dependent oxidoreductase [Patescibacteria group bacterium]|nr:NAD(P)H-dependent oxidoreductase [Patescibacteria group bacterium]